MHYYSKWWLRLHYSQATGTTSVLKSVRMSQREDFAKPSQNQKKAKHHPSFAPILLPQNSKTQDRNKIMDLDELPPFDAVAVDVAAPPNLDDQLSTHWETPESDGKSPCLVKHMRKLFFGLFLVAIVGGLSYVQGGVHVNNKTELVMWTNLLVRMESVFQSKWFLVLSTF